MSFTLPVKIDAGTTLPTIKSIGAELAATETKATATSKAFDATTSALKREADMLEKIRGPMREYNADQDALQRLFEKNTISAKEYTDQVEKLNAQFAKAPKGEEHHKGFEVEGSFGKSVAGQFGEAGTIAGGVASGALEAAGVVGLAVEIGHLGDEYTALANKAVRFTDAGHDTNAILQDQLALSYEVHGGLEQTVEIYSALREGTDGLNYSYQDQITATKSLAQEVQLSGKGLEQSAGLMARLSYAFESGTITGRELKGLFREFPALGETLRDSFGKSSAELMKMANQGTLAPQMILDALIAKAPEIGERFEKMAETSATKWQHFKDEVTLSIGGSIPSLDQMVHKLAELEPPEVKAAQAMADFKAKVDATLNPVALVAAQMREIADKAREASTYASLQEKAIANDEEAAKAAAKKHQDDAYDKRVKREQAEALAAYKKAQEEELALIKEIQGPVAELDHKLEGLEVVYAKGKVTLNEYNDALIRWGVTLQTSAQLGVDLGGIKRATQAFDPKLVEEMKQFSKEVTAEATKMETDKHKMLTEQWKLETDSYKRHVSEMSSALKPLEDAIVNLAKTGKFAWNDMLDAMLAALTQKLVGQAGGALAGALASAFGGGGGGPLDYVVNGVGTGIPLTNPNGPGTPSARMAPSGGSQPGGVTVIVQSDPSMLIPALQTPGGNQVITTVSDKRAAVQARLRAPR